MRVVIVGATGNVGTALSRRMGSEPDVDVVGVARRIPREGALPVEEWHSRDIARDDLEDILRGADAAVHLGWEIQPSHDEAQLARTNLVGSRRVFEAVVRAGVPRLVYASSVGVYSPGPKDRRVDETWPRDGIRTSFYARHKAAVERSLDQVEREHPDLRVVRLRPGLIFSRAAASEIRRLFIGPLFPSPLARRSFVPFIPRLPRLAFQCLHSDDTAEAYRLAIRSDVHGAFNVAAEPVIDTGRLVRLVGAPSIKVPAAVARGIVAATWRLHLQPTSPGWLDLALSVPLMDCTRAERELGWSAARTAEEALLELIQGLRDGEGADTPPLAPETSGWARSKELGSGVGSKNP